MNEAIDLPAARGPGLCNERPPVVGLSNTRHLGLSNAVGATGYQLSAIGSGLLTTHDWLCRLAVLPSCRLRLIADSRRYSARSNRGSRRSSQGGNHQFQWPRSCIAAGTRMMRISVASISTAAASENPSVLTSVSRAKVNAAKTLTMIAAAAVITAPVRCNPRYTAA